MNIYSVWNGSRYSVYRSNSAPIPSFGSLGYYKDTNLGADPMVISGNLPEDSKYDGESENAVGTIVNGEMRSSSMLKYIAIAAVLYYFFHK